MNPLERFEIDRRVGGEQIRRLSADQPVDTNCRREELGQAAGEGRLVAAGQGIVGEVQESERRKDGDRLAEFEVVRRAASSQRCIVHGRKVVEDQGRGVHQLHGDRGGNGPRGGGAAQLGAEQRQDGAHALGRRVNGVRHGLLDAAARRGHDALQLRVDRALVLEEERRDPCHRVIADAGVSGRSKISMYW
jgi:hypothetical protein